MIAAEHAGAVASMALGKRNDLAPQFDVAICPRLVQAEGNQRTNQNRKAPLIKLEFPHLQFSFSSWMLLTVNARDRQ